MGWFHEIAAYTTFNQDYEEEEEDDRESLISMERGGGRPGAQGMLPCAFTPA